MTKKWTRSELVAKAKTLGIKNIAKKNMNELCKEMNICTVSMHDVKIEGCHNVTEWEYNGVRSQGRILCIGEIHDLDGNMKELIQQMLKKTNVPIDICVEKAYSDYEDIFNCLPQYAKSLSCYFYSDNIRICSEKGIVPKQTHIKPNTTFFRKCIKPYKGRIKIWATDLRHTSFFFFFRQFPNINKVKKKKFFKTLLSYSLYKKSRLQYDHDICTQYRNIILEIDPSNVDKYMKLLNTDKNHVRLMQDLSFFPEKIIKLWIRIISHYLLNINEEFYKQEKNPMITKKPLQNVNKSDYAGQELLLGIMDVYTVMRILRLTNTNENRLIIFIGGVLHRHIIDKLLQVYSTNYPKKLKFIHKKLCEEGQTSTETFVDLSNIISNKKTTRMEEYERFSKKKNITKKKKK